MSGRPPPLTADEREALGDIIDALKSVGDGDLKVGLTVFGDILRIVRATGEKDPVAGVDRLRSAIAMAYRVEAMARFTRWLILGLVGLAVLAGQTLESLQKMFVWFRGAGR